MKKKTRWRIFFGGGLLLLGLAVFIYVPYRVADAQYEQLVQIGRASCRERV